MVPLIQPRVDPGERHGVHLDVFAVVAATRPDLLEFTGANEGDDFVRHTSGTRAVHDEFERTGREAGFLDQFASGRLEDRFVGLDMVADQAGRLGRVSEADQARRHAFWTKIREELDAVSCERLSREDCIDYRVFRGQIDNFLAEYETRAYLVPFNSDWGFYMAWGRLPAETTFEDLDDFGR